MYIKYIMSIFSLRNSGNGSFSISGLPDGFLKSDSTGISATTTIDTNDLSNTVQTRLNTIEGNITTLQSSSASGGITTAEAITIATNVSQPATQNIGNFGKSWSQLTNAPTDNGVGIACSGNGQYILKLGWSAQSYLSTDFGATWNAVGALGYTQWAASLSFDGKYMLVSTITGGAILSTNYGVDWSYVGIGGTPQNSKISFNGKNMVIATTNGIYSSTNYGSSFTSIKSESWKSVTASSDGQTIYAVKDASPPTIWKTTNNGVSWTNIYSNPNSISFDTMSCSANGKYVLVGLGQGVSSYMYLSNDYGATFNQLGASNGLSQGNYFKVDIDSSGMYMVTVCNTGHMFYSTNYGQNWTQSPLPSTYYYGVAISDNANYIYAYAPGNKVYAYNSAIMSISTTQSGFSGKGDIYFDEATNKLYIYNSTSSAWKSVTLA